MSKYNLMELLNEYVGGSRHGTLNITFKDLESEMNEVGNIGDFVVRKNSNVSDKVNHEFEIIPIGNVTGKGEEKGGIRIYDYKFGFNPAEELTDKEHPFSVGGDDKGDTLSLFKFLFPKRARGYFEKDISNIDPDAWSESPSYGKLGTEIDEEMSDKDKDFEKAKEADRLEKHPERDKIKAIQALLAKEKLKKESMGNKKINEGDLFSSKFDRPHLKDIIRDLNEEPIFDMAVRRAYKFLVSLLDAEDKAELGLKESTGPSDKAETEDDVVNVDKVAGPSAKGVGYGAETSANTAEDDQEDKEIQNPPPMYEDMNLASIAKKLGIDMDDLKNKIKKMKSREKDEIEASARASMAENTRLSNEVSDRIEGLLNQPMKKKFMDVGMDLVQDLLEEDPFDIDDVIQHLANELGKYYDDFLGAGERLNSIEIDENGNAEDFTKELKEAVAEEESVADYLMDYYRNPNKPEETMVDEKIVGEYFKTHEDWDLIWGKSYEEGLQDFEEFFDINYGIMFPSAGEIDENLKKHFKRFM